MKYVTQRSSSTTAGLGKYFRCLWTKQNATRSDLYMSTAVLIVSLPTAAVPYLRTMIMVLRQRRTYEAAVCLHVT